MHNIGIDLGTTNILVYVEDKGIVLNEPNVVAYDNNKNKIVAIGKEAYDMLGKTSENISIIKPMKDGVIADFDVMEAMLKKILKPYISKRIISKSNIILCSPSNITGVEKNALNELGERLNAKRVYIEEEPKLAALGAGLDILKPNGSMIVDIGGGTTDMALLSLGEVIVSDSIKVSGSTFIDDIIAYVKKKYKVVIGEATALEILEEIGTVIKSKLKTKEVTGRGIDSGLPEAIVVTSSDIEVSLKNDIKKIVEAIKNVFEKIPPELLKDVKDRGLILTGGGSLVGGLVDKLRKDLKIPVFISDDPLTNVALGTGYLFKNSNYLKY